MCVGLHLISFGDETPFPAALTTNPSPLQVRVHRDHGIAGTLDAGGSNYISINQSTLTEAVRRLSTRTP